MKNLKIRTKLITLGAFSLICLILVGVSSLFFMTNINNSTTEIANNWLPSIIAVEEMNTALSDMRVQELKHVLSQNQAEMDSVNTQLDTLLATFNERYNDYQPLLANDTDKKLLEEIKSLMDQYTTTGEKMLALSAEKKTTEAMEVLTGESKQIFDSLTAKCLELVNFNKTSSDAVNANADSNYATAQKLMVFILILVTIITIVFSLYIIRGITKPVHEIDTVARKIADGNLDEAIHYESKDELGILAVNFNKTVTRLRDYVNYIDEISKVLNEVANGNLLFELTYDYAVEFAKVKTALENISESLNQTLTQINQSSEQVASGSDQVASGSQALSQGATEQASSIQELAATINDISSQVNQSASYAIEASKKASSVGEQILSSNEQMQQMTSAMAEINDKSSQIGKIIKTIEDIAFQTNILALNAAVEAARAGEAGKGFAVVADEVRNLASKSAEASKDTSLLIEGSMQAVEKGTQIANATASQLVEVVSGAEEIVTTIDNIAAASTQQAESIKQVTTGVDQISSVVQTNSATAEESAAASEELSGQAQILKDLVSRFRLKGTSSETSYRAKSSNSAYDSSAYEQMDSMELDTASYSSMNNSKY